MGRGARRSSVVRAFRSWCDGSSDRSFMGWGARRSSVVRAFAHGVMGRRIDPSWGEGARCSSVVRAFRLWCDGSSDRSFMGWTH